MFEISTSPMLAPCLLGGSTLQGQPSHISSVRTSSGARNMLACFAVFPHSFAVSLNQNNSNHQPAANFILLLVPGEGSVRIILRLLGKNSTLSSPKNSTDPPPPQVLLKFFNRLLGARFPNFAKGLSPRELCKLKPQGAWFIL